MIGTVWRCCECKGVNIKGNTLHQYATAHTTNYTYLQGPKGEVVHRRDSIYGTVNKVSHAVGVGPG